MRQAWAVRDEGRAIGNHSCFDVRTGKVTNGPAKVDLKTFKIETHEGKIYVGVPTS